MCSVPDGYGSISSWYQWRSSASSPGAGFGVWKARSSSQTRCHFASICLWVVSLHIRPSWVQKSLSGERPWEADAASPRCSLLYARSACILSAV